MRGKARPCFVEASSCACSWCCEPPRGLSGPDAQYLRCGANVVAVGDRKFDLLQRCGEPDHTEARTPERAVLVWDPGREALRELRTTVEVEEWTYNFGPHRFYYVVRLEDGRVTAIETGGRGY